MLVATFGPSTGWNGKTITYDAGVFTLEDQGTISAADVLAYDRQGHLQWAYAGLREWTATQAEQTQPIAPLVGAAVSDTAANRSATNHRYLLVALVTIAALFALAAVVWAFSAARSVNEITGGSGTTVVAPSSSGTMTTVFA